MVEAFGSEKQKRLLTSRKKNESVQETISDKVADIAKTIPLSADKDKKEPSSVDDVSIMPPKNVKASTLDELYHIDDIICFQDYQSLLGEAQHFINCDNEKISEWESDKTYVLTLIY